MSDFPRLPRIRWALPHLARLKFCFNLWRLHIDGAVLTGGALMKQPVSGNAWLAFVCQCQPSAALEVSLELVPVSEENQLDDRTVFSPVYDWIVRETFDVYWFAQLHGTYSLNPNMIILTCTALLPLALQISEVSLEGITLSWNLPAHLNHVLEALGMKLGEQLVRHRGRDSILSRVGDAGPNVLIPFTNLPQQEAQSEHIFVVELLMIGEGSHLI